MSTESPSDEIVENAELGPSNVELILSFSAGVFGVAVLAVVAALIQYQVEIINFFNYFTPFTLAAVGLGSGHYFGLTYEKKSDRRAFFLGAFVALALIFGYSTNWGVGTVISDELLLILGFLFASLVHISGLVSNNEDFENFMNVFSGDVSRAYIVGITFLKYSVSGLVSVLPAIESWTKIQLVTAIGVGLLAVILFGYFFGIGAGHMLDSD